DPVLTPEGWQRNWFSSVDVTGRRTAVSATWDRAGLVAHGSHSVSATLRVHHRAMDGTLADKTIRVTNEDGMLVRLVEFGAAGPLDPSELNVGGGVRDLWDVNGRLQLDLGARLDGGAATPVAAPRFGLRYLVDEAGRTTLRASAGRYAGRVPLAAEAFGALPPRTNSYFDPVTGAPVRTVVYQPAVSVLPLPRADAVAIEVEHRLTPTLELQAGARMRHGSHLPSVDVPVDAGGETRLLGTGTSDYRELQVAVRKTWTNQSQFFVSYVRATSKGDTNDFGSLFTNLDAPLLDRNARAVTSADVPHRLRGWATFSLPLQTVVSPAVDWRTGFPYSALNLYQQYAEPPNSRRFPNYLSVDVTAFKTFDLFGRKM